MSTNVSHLADNIKPVTRGTILVVDITAGAVIVDLMDAANHPPGDGNDPAKDFWFGEYVSLQADGGAFYFYFAPDNVPAITPRTAGFGTGAQCVRVEAGMTVDQLNPFNPALQSTGGGPVPLPPPRRYLHLIKAPGAGTTFVNLWPSSTKAM